VGSATRRRRPPPRRERSGKRSAGGGHGRGRRRPSHQGRRPRPRRPATRSGRGAPRRARAQVEAHRGEHALRLAAAEKLTAATQARARWAAQTAVTLDHGRLAKAELEERGVPWDNEPDRTSAEEWLAAERQARRADYPHHVITEADIAVEDEARSTIKAADTNDSEDTHIDEGTSSEGTAHAEPVVTPGFEPNLDPTPKAEETSAANQTVGNSTSSSAADDTAEILADRRSPAHDVISPDPSPAELDATLAAASLVIARSNDYVSEDAAHEASNDIPIVAETERRRRDTAFLDLETTAPITALVGDVLDDE
jgi:hypothetical protein